jgi:hypothetical protein
MTKEQKLANKWIREMKKMGLTYEQMSEVFKLAALKLKEFKTSLPKRTTEDE